MLIALGADPHEDISPGPASMEDTNERKRARAELDPERTVEF
jgi:hypothetical protein